MSLRIWKRNLKKLVGSSCSPRPIHSATCGHTSPRVSEMASSGMVVDAELLLPTDGEEKSPKRLRVGTTGEEAPSLQQGLLLKTRSPRKTLVPLFTPSSCVSSSWKRNKARLNNATSKNAL